MGTPYISEVKIVAFNFAPKGWSLCNGQLLSINQNQALFSLLGTTYGGNGSTTFGLPNLQGRVPLHFGQGFTQGAVGGETNHTLTVQEMAAHTHLVQVDNTTAASSNASTPGNTVTFGQSIGIPSSGSNFAASMYGAPTPAGTLSPNSISNAGGSQAHENEQPYLVLNYVIALVGVFPSRN
jgi:microcystin-dependent protein